MNGIALLDVNVLVALFFTGHSHHEVAHDWFDEQRAHGWATSPTTENGVVRILSNRTYILDAWRPAEVVEKLRAFRRSGQHHFWAESVTLTDERVFNTSLIGGHRQVTDIYLLGVATAAGGALATFDRGISIGAVKGATKANLQVISAVPAESRSEDR